MGKLLKFIGFYLLIQSSLASAMSINTLYSPASSNSPGIQITNSSGTSSVIQYTKIRFYSDAGCNSPLGFGAISGGERSFNNAETVSINSSSIYQIAEDNSVNPASVLCATISICSNSDGSSGNCNERGTLCPSFNLTCGASTCTSNTTVTVSTYGTSGGVTCTI